MAEAALVARHTVGGLDRRSIFCQAGRSMTPMSPSTRELTSEYIADSGKSDIFDGLV